MRKLVIGFVVVSMIASAPAFAGEVSGNGKSVPGATQGSSECSYSGRNDTPEDPMGFTQTFASFWRYIIGFVDPTAPWHPGTACQGN